MLDLVSLPRWRRFRNLFCRFRPRYRRALDLVEEQNPGSALDSARPPSLTAEADFCGIGFLGVFSSVASGGSEYATDEHDGKDPYGPGGPLHPLSRKVFRLAPEPPYDPVASDSEPFFSRIHHRMDLGPRYEPRQIPVGFYSLGFYNCGVDSGLGYYPIDMRLTTSLGTLVGPGLIGEINIRRLLSFIQQNQPLQPLPQPRPIGPSLPRPNPRPTEFIREGSVKPPKR